MHPRFPLLSRISLLRPSRGASPRIRLLPQRTDPLPRQVLRILIILLKAKPAGKMFSLVILIRPYPAVSRALTSTTP